MDPRVDLYEFAKWTQDNKIESAGDGRWNVPSSTLVNKWGKGSYPTLYSTEQLVQKYLKEKE